MEAPGRTMLLKDGSVQLASIKAKTVTINNELIDISTDDSNGWRTLLALPGEKSVDISFDGVSKDNVLKTLVSSSTDVSIAPLTIEFEDGSTIIGTFMLENLANTGNFKEAITFSGSLKSSGTIAFTWV